MKLLNILLLFVILRMLLKYKGATWKALKKTTLTLIVGICIYVAVLVVLNKLMLLSEIEVDIAIKLLSMVGSNLFFAFFCFYFLFQIQCKTKLKRYLLSMIVIFQNIYLSMFFSELFLSLTNFNVDFTSTYYFLILNQVNKVLVLSFFLIDIAFTISSLKYIHNDIIDEYIKLINNGKLILSLVTCLATIFGSESVYFINTNSSKQQINNKGKPYLVGVSDIDNIFKMQSMDFIITAYLLDKNKRKKSIQEEFVVK